MHVRVGVQMPNIKLLNRGNIAVQWERSSRVWDLPSACCSACANFPVVLQVLDALISVEKVAGGAVDGPLATIALAAAPLQDMPSSITSAVTTFLGG